MILSMLDDIELTSTYLLTCFVYISVTGSILFWQLQLIDLGKEFGIFIQGRKSPPRGEGSDVALYLVLSYSRKSN